MELTTPLSRVFARPLLLPAWQPRPGRAVARTRLFVPVACGGFAAELPVHKIPLDDPRSDLH